MKALYQTILRVMNLFFLCLLTLRMCLVISNTDVSVEEASRIYWESADMVLLLISLLLVLLPNLSVNEWVPLKSVPVVLQHIDYILGRKFGTFIAIIICAFCVSVNFTDIMSYSSYFLVVGFLFDSLLQTYVFHPVDRIRKFLQKYGALSNYKKDRNKI